MNRIVFDARAAPRQQQFDAFYDAVRNGLIRVTPERPHDIDCFDARLVSFRSGSMSAHILAAPNHRAARRRQDFQSGDPDELHVSMLLSGKRACQTDDFSTSIEAGDIFALDTRKPFAFGDAPGTFCALKLAFPLREVGADAASLAHHHPQKLQDHRLYPVLKSACGAIALELEDGDATELALLISVARGLVSVIGRDSQRVATRELEADIRPLVRLQLEQSLYDPELSLDSVACRLGLSRRAVQRALSAHDTSFSQMLGELRMINARTLLCESTKSIQEIALSCGYVELASFYRAFKRRFGMPPGEVRGADRDAAFKALDFPQCRG